MKTNRSQAYQLLLMISDELRNSAFERKIVEEKFHYDVFRRTDTGRTTVAVKDLVWTNLADGWNEGLNGPTQLFVLKHVIPAVKYANMLWHWPVQCKSQERKAIKELIDNKVLFRTEVPGLYLINPIKIWKCNPITCVEATKDLIRTEGKPALHMIRDLRPGDRYSSRTLEDRFNSLTDNGITPNLLQEPNITISNTEDSTRLE